MSNPEFSVTGLSISRASQGVPKNQQIQGNQKKPVRFQISPASTWTKNDDTRRVQLEVTATPLAKQAEQKVRFWSQLESYSAQSAVNQNEEGGDNQQVLHGDENSNVEGVAHSTDVLSSLSGFGRMNPHSVVTSVSATDEVVVSSPRRIIMSSPPQQDSLTPKNRLIKAPTGLTPSLSAVTMSKTCNNGDINRNSLPAVKTDSNNNCNAAVNHSPKEALATIRQFLVASQQRVVVLKKNLVDYGVDDSSNSSDEEQGAVLSDVASPCHAGGKRKVEDNEREKEEVKIKRKCTQEKEVAAKVGCEAEGVEMVERKDSVVSVSTCFIGPIDTRCVTARKNLETAINVQRMAETFESKHYGRKSGIDVKEEFKIEVKQSQCLGFSPYHNSQPKSSVSVVSSSPRVTYSNSPAYESPRIKNKSDRSLRSFVSLVKSKGMLQSKSSEAVKSFINRSENAQELAGNDLYNSTTNQLDNVPSKVGSKTADKATPSRHPFWASCGNSTYSPLMGQRENDANEEVKSTLKKHFRTISAPENRPIGNVNPDLHKSQDSFNLSGNTTNVTGASLMPSRLRFYQNSRLSSSFSPRSNSLTYDWKENFKKTSGSYGVPYLDSHCHLDFLFNRGRFIGSWSWFKAVNSDTFPDNFAGCVAVFCNPLTFKSEGLWKDVSCEKDVWLAFGCHPKSATDFSMKCYNGLRECLQHEKVVALGEIGLDYSGTFKQHMDVQKIVFRRQIQLALEMKKPLVIHCRDAEDDCLQILQEMVPRNYKIHCHCFTGDYSGAQRWMEAFPRLYIGLTPMVTYRQCVQTHNVARYLPLNKLLLETDAPYFLPKKIPKEEMALSHPGMAITVAERVAFFRQCSIQEVLQACRNNTRDMYGI